MKRRECLKLIGSAAVSSFLPGSSEASRGAEPASNTLAGFGASAIVLGLPGKQNGIAFDRFLRAGGFPVETPTSAIVWWDADLLHVEFNNTEPDPLYRGNPGLAKPLKYPGNERFQISAYPDAVYVHYRTSWKEERVFLFAADSSGASDGDGLDIEVDVRRSIEAWTAHFRIPWQSLGGRPTQVPFGLNIVRSRGQSSEVLSPVALDQTLVLPPDLLMSSTFGKHPAVRSVPGFLIQLADGTRRWQLPAQLMWPDERERRTLWRQQERLDRATTPETLPERVQLAQRLYDTLVLEGLSFHTDGASWPVGPGEFYPHEARIAVNRALCLRDSQSACRMLDIFLCQLDRVTRRWFADESPGNVRTAEWTSVDRLEDAQRDGDELRLTAMAGQYKFFLWLSFANGGMRLRNEHAGFFRPDRLEHASIGANSISASGVSVRIENNPWRIAVLDDAGRERWSIGRGDLSFRLSPSGEVLAVDLSGKLSSAENVYGFGERFNALGQRGRVVTLWDQDCWDGNVHGQLNQAYKNVPLMHSTGGYSLFWNTSYRVRADIGNAYTDRYRITAFGNIFDIFLWPASPEKALQSYTKLTGKPILPPRWAFGPWMGGAKHRWPYGRFKSAAQVDLNAVQRFQELDIPHSAIYAEAANADPELYAGLKGKNLRVLAWDYASMNYEKVRQLLPGVRNSELPVLRHADGQPAFRDEKNAIVDYTHPLAEKLLQRFWEPRFDLGVAGSMVDFGDMVPEDAVFYNGKRGAEMHNFYAYSYHRLFARVFQQKRGQDYVLFARSGCAGDPHSICYFAGDIQANFFGMRAALRGGLNAASCGFSTWGADAGGYVGWPDPEVYIRWTEWAAFSPLMRFHGTTPREPWEFGDDAVAIYKRYAWLRENLVPYIEGSAQQAHATGIPIIRPMPFAFPNEPLLANCDDQYLFGPDLLVAPMLGPGKFRTVLFPAGDWTDFWTANSYTGPASIRVAMPLDRIGVFLRAGACVPLELSRSLVPGDSMSAGRLKVVLTTDPTASARLNAKTYGARHLLVYGGGRKRIMSVDPDSESVDAPSTASSDTKH